MNRGRFLSIFCACCIFLWTPINTQAETNKEALPIVALITTGGTIAEKTDPKTGAAVPALSGEDLVKSIPSISKIAKIKVINFSNIDSSQMTPGIWARLSKTVDSTLKDPEIVGAVVVHGTDTMAEGAYFLDLTLDTNKPVVFVGSMNDASDISTEGPENLYNAVLQAASEEAKGWGVTVTLNQYINSARDVRKVDTTNVQAFSSGHKGYLGYIEMGKVIRYNERDEDEKLPIPDKLPRVMLITTYAGADGNLVRYAVDSGVKGIVIEGLGAGNVSAKVYEAIKYAIEKNIPVVLTTRVYYGGVYPIYGVEGGGATLKKEGVIFGGDLTGPHARILLMLALPYVGNDPEKLAHYFKF